VRERPRDLDRADALLEPAIDASRGDEGLDDVSLVQVVAYLAESHRAEDDGDRARELSADARRLASEKGIPAEAIGLAAEDDGRS
jgi:hypothetical protein